MCTPTYRILTVFAPTIALLGTLIVGAFNCAIGAEPRSVRDILYLAIKSDPGSHLVSQNSDNSSVAKLTVKVRISAHSQETNFFGDVPATMSEFDLSKGSHEQEIWKDAKCHHERGYPKLTVISVDGFVASGQRKFPVAARYRWIGLLLPRDEVMPAKPIKLGSDNMGPFFATRTETKNSRLVVDLKMYMLPCDLSANASQ